jgi:hypothetical protein
VALPRLLPAPVRTGSAFPKFNAFSGLWVRFRAYTLHLVKRGAEASIQDTPPPTGRLTSRLTRESLNFRFLSWLCFIARLNAKFTIIAGYLSKFEHW